MLPTPDLSHLSKDDYKHVYEPAEDTFILLDALEADAPELQCLNATVCLEIGSGSGCVSAFVGQILGPSRCLYLSTDINPRASICTLKTGKQNSVPLEAVQTSLDGPLAQRLHRQVDILIFNPPYVPTAPEEANQAQEEGSIPGSWAGGLQGMEITNKVLSTVGSMLSANGCFYLVAVKTNDIPSIQRKLLHEQELDSHIVLQRRAGREHLFVIRFQRRQAS